MHERACACVIFTFFLYGSRLVNYFTQTHIQVTQHCIHSLLRAPRCTQSDQPERTMRRPSPTVRDCSDSSLSSSSYMYVHLNTGRSGGWTGVGSNLVSYPGTSTRVLFAAVLHFPLSAPAPFKWAWTSIGLFQKNSQLPDVCM